MAVRVPANTRCEIRFDYKTPNFTLGLGVTGACVVVFIAYMLIPTKLKRKKRENMLFLKIILKQMR